MEAFLRFHLGILLAMMLALALGCEKPTEKPTLNIATYNIRFDSPTDSGNMWQDRAKHLTHLIKYHQMDIVGTQEGLYHQLETMKSHLGMPYVGAERDDGATAGEFCAIFYDPNKLTLLQNGTFWLSPTPDVPSKGWDAALNRVCTWAKFKDAAHADFYVFNVHYDHIGQQAREESSRLLLQKIGELNTEHLPIVLLGDFNVTPDNPAYTTITSGALLADARLISQIPAYGPKGTFNGFRWNFEPNAVIDHIFVSNHYNVLKHGIITDNYGLKYPSDHFPVIVTVRF